MSNAFKQLIAAQPAPKNTVELYIAAAANAVNLFQTLQDLDLGEHPDSCAEANAILDYYQQLSIEQIEEISLPKLDVIHGFGVALIANAIFWAHWGLLMTEHIRNSAAAKPMRANVAKALMSIANAVPYALDEVDSEQAESSSSVPNVFN